jgi:hypothetical protein
MWTKMFIQDMGILWRRVAAAATFFNDVAIPSFLVCPPNQTHDLLTAANVLVAMQKVAGEILSCVL